MMTPTMMSRGCLVMLLWMAASVLTTGAAGPAAAPQKEPRTKVLPIPGEVFEVQGCTAFLIRPAQQPAGQLTPWVWYAPTLPALPESTEAWMFQKFLAAGVAIAGIDVGESMGNPQGRAGYSALYEELVNHRGLARKACLLGRSRGGLMLYNWAAEHPDAIACIVGIYPVCNLSSWPGLATACPAYGMTEAELTAHLAEHNPIERLAGLAKARVPILHIHGDADSMVPFASNSGELAKRYQQLGGMMTLIVAKGHGHDFWPGFFQCQELVDFVITNATPTALAAPAGRWTTKKILHSQLMISRCTMLSRLSPAPATSDSW